MLKQSCSIFEFRLILHMKWRIVLGIILLVLLIVSIGWNRKNAWEGSLGSPAALGRAVVDALNRGDVDGLHRLRVDQDEYSHGFGPLSRQAVHLIILPLILHGQIWIKMRTRR